MVVGGMHGCRAACMVAGGHAWLQGTCMVVGGCVCGYSGGVCGCGGGMHGCVGVCVGYDEIRSMSGQYASYWNAFLSG